MVMNPRGKHSHLYGILSAGGGFDGFPAGGNLKSGYSTEEPLGSFEIKQTRIMPKLNNGRRWVHPNDAMPQHKEDMAYKLNAFSKSFLLNGFAQSNPNLAAFNGRPSNPETASFMNPKNNPRYPDLEAVHNQVDTDYNVHHKEVDVKTAREMFTTAEESFIKDYKLKVAELRSNKIAQALLEKGYSEDEVAAYFANLRARDIEKEVKKAEEEGTTPAEVLQKLYNDNGRSGENATGIVPLGATQSVSVHKLAVNELKGVPGIKTRLKLRGKEDYSGIFEEESVITSVKGTVASDPKTQPRFSQVNIGEGSNPITKYLKKK